MRVLVRADASVEIGTGHVVRCVTLAEELAKHHVEVAFASRDLPGHLLDWIQQKGFVTLTLPATHADDADVTVAAIQDWVGHEIIDWIIVDHYGLDAQWERKIRQKCRNILVVDDLANRPHDCDLLLDQNALEGQSSQYQNLIPFTCKQLLGPKYALLRPEFHQARAERHVDLYADSRKILAFFGGSDPTGECFKALDAFKLLPTDYSWKVDLVAGGSNPRFEELQRLTQDLPQVRLHRQVSDMAHLMSQADISIGAGGTTTWERFCLGLPSLVIAVADNQVEISRNLAENGYLLYLGQSNEVPASQISQALWQLLNDSPQRQRLAEQGMALVDGLGVKRVTETLFALSDERIQ